MERYFEAIGLKDEATKVRTATLYLIDNETLWWRRKFMEMERKTCTIDTWVVMLEVGETEGTRIIKKDPMRPLLAEKAKVETGIGISSQRPIVSCVMDHIRHANVLRGRLSVL